MPRSKPACARCGEVMFWSWLFYAWRCPNLLAHHIEGGPTDA